MSFPTLPTYYLHTLREALKETQERLAAAHTSLETNEDLKAITEHVYESNGTDMGDFWLSFLEITDPSRNAKHYLSSDGLQP
jgi:hypothetical protein